MYFTMSDIVLAGKNMKMHNLSMDFVRSLTNALFWGSILFYFCTFKIHQGPVVISDVQIHEIHVLSFIFSDDAQLKYGFCKKLLLYKWTSEQLNTFFIKIRFTLSPNLILMRKVFNCSELGSLLTKSLLHSDWLVENT